MDHVVTALSTSVACLGRLEGGGGVGDVAGGVEGYYSAIGDLCSVVRGCLFIIGGVPMADDAEGGRVNGELAVEVEQLVARSKRFVGVARLGEGPRVGSGSVRVDVVADPSLAALHPNLERNRAARLVKKQRKLRKQEKAKQDDVPEWRRKFATGELADTWAARKVRENKIAIMKADEQIKRLESGAGKPRLQSKVLTEAEQEAKIRADYNAHMQKTNADIAYWKKRQEAGAVDKAIKLEMEIMDGQISGKYDPFASRRTIGWAKTVKTDSSTGSSAKKTVWSGSGASGRSGAVSGTSESVVSMEKYLGELELKDRRSKEREDKLKREIEDCRLRVKNSEEKAMFFKKKALEKLIK